ncbi:hypothetical protein DUHN26_11830 [Helicobacter pylori]|nr:hypothetical protein VN1289_13940 [Helicobacter pylori]
MMVLENACEFNKYLSGVFDEMGFYGSFEVVGKNINLNNIPNAISNGKLSKDDLGRLKIEFKNQRVGLNDSWKGETLNNRWVITSYELNQSRNELIESPLAPNYKGKDTNPLNLDNSNHTTNKE